MPDPVAKCDFCMAPDPEPVSVVVSTPVLMVNVLTTGEWATCAHCLRDLTAGTLDAMFKRWMSNAGSAAVAAALLRGDRVVVAEWHNHLDQLWRTAWTRRTEVREASSADRLEMVAELEKFRQAHPDRILP